MALLTPLNRASRSTRNPNAQYVAEIITGSQQEAVNPSRLANTITSSQLQSIEAAQGEDEEWRPGAEQITASDSDQDEETSSSSGEGDSSDGSDEVLGLADRDDALQGQSLPFTKKEDRLLIELVRRHGRRWQRIKQIFEKKTSRRTVGQKGYAKRYDTITRGSSLHVPADPNAATPAAKNSPRVLWSYEEEQLLIKVTKKHLKLGTQGLDKAVYAEFSSLPGVTRRTPATVKNKRLKLFKKASANKQRGGHANRTRDADADETSETDDDMGPPRPQRGARTLAQQGKAGDSSMLDDYSEDELTKKVRRNMAKQEATLTELRKYLDDSAGEGEKDSEDEVMRLSPMVGCRHSAESLVAGETSRKKVGVGGGSGFRRGNDESDEEGVGGGSGFRRGSEDSEEDQDVVMSGSPPPQKTGADTLHPRVAAQVGKANMQASSKAARASDATAMAKPNSGSKTGPVLTSSHKPHTLASKAAAIASNICRPGQFCTQDMPNGDKFIILPPGSRVCGYWVDDGSGSGYKVRSCLEKVDWPCSARAEEEVGIGVEVVFAEDGKMHILAANDVGCEIGEDGCFVFNHYDHTRRLLLRVQR